MPVVQWRKNLTYQQTPLHITPLTPPINEVHSPNESPSPNKSLLTGFLTNDHQESLGELKMDMNDLITQSLQRKQDKN